MDWDAARVTLKKGKKKIGMNMVPSVVFSQNRLELCMMFKPSMKWKMMRRMNSPLPYRNLYGCVLYGGVGTSSQSRVWGGA